MVEAFAPSSAAVASGSFGVAGSSAALGCAAAVPEKSHKRKPTDDAARGRVYFLSWSE